jgi:hypothetical protein
VILVRVEGSHFLWKMVRRMVGVMVEADAAVHPTTPSFLREDSATPAKLRSRLGPVPGVLYYQGDRRHPPLRAGQEEHRGADDHLMKCPSCGTMNRVPPPQPGRKVICGNQDAAWRGTGLLHVTDGRRAG